MKVKFYTKVQDFNPNYFTQLDTLLDANKRDEIYFQLVKYVEDKGFKIVPSNYGYTRKNPVTINSSVYYDDKIIFIPQRRLIFDLYAFVHEIGHIIINQKVYKPLEKYMHFNYIKFFGILSIKERMEKNLKKSTTKHRFIFVSEEFFASLIGWFICKKYKISTKLFGKTAWYCLKTYIK